MAEGLWFNIGCDNTEFVQKSKETNSALSSMSQNVKAFTNGIKASFTEAAKSMVGFYAVAKAGTMFQDMIAQNDQFNKSMKEVGTLSEEVAKNLDDYKNKVLELTTEIPIGANDAAQALYQINSAGHTGAEGMEVLEASAKAAIGGVTDTATAADAITTVLNAYKMNASQAGEVSDKLFTAVRLGKTTMGELGSTIAQVAPIAASYGVSIDEVLAAVSTLTKSGTPTANAMTQVRAAIVSMADSMGATVFQTHTLQEAMVAMRDAIPDENKLKDAMGRIEGYNGLLGMTGINAKTAADDLKEFSNSAGAAGAAYDAMNTGKGAEVTKLQNNILKEMAGISNQISNVVAKVAKAMNEAFDTGQMEDYISTIKSLVVTYGIYKASAIALTAAQKVCNVVMEEYRYQQALANIGNATFISLQKGMAASTTAVTAAQVAQSTVLGMLTRAWQSLTLSMMENPLGWIAIAIAAVGYAIYESIDAMEAESERVKGVTGDLDEYGRSTEDVKKAHDELNDSYKNAQAELVEMTAKLEGFTGSKEDEKKLVDDCNSKYGDAMGYYSSVADWYKVLTANSETYCQQLIVEAELRQYANQIAENDQKKHDILYNEDGTRKQYNTERSHVSDGQRLYTVDSDLDVANKDIANLNRANRSLQQQMQAKLKESAKLQKQLQSAVPGTTRVKNPSPSTSDISISTGDTKKTKNSANELAQMREKTAEEEAKWDSAIERQHREAGYASQEAYIAGLKEGEEKRLAQLKLNHQKQMDAIDDQAIEMKKAVYEHNKTIWENTKGNKGKAYSDTKEGSAGWQGIQLNDEQKQQIADLQTVEVEAYNKSYKEIIDAETKAQNEYLINYGDYQEKKLALKAKYDALIEKEETEYGKESLRKDYQKADKDLDITQFKKGINWDTIFGNLEGIDKVTLEHVRAQLQMFIDTTDNLQPSDIKDLYSALQNLDEHIDMTNTISAFRKARQEAKEAEKEVAEAQENLMHVQLEKSLAQAELSVADSNVEEAEEEKENANASGDVDKITAAEKKYKDAIEARNSAQSKLSATVKKVTNAQNDLRQKQQKAIKSDSKEKKSAEDLRASLENLAGQMASLGQTVGGTGGQVLTFAANAVSAFNVVSKGIQTIKADVISLESAVAILMIIQAAFTAIQSLGNLFGVFGDTKDYDKMKDQYESLIDIWDELISKKQEYIDISYGSEATKAAEEVESLYEKEADAARKVGKKYLGSGGGWFSDTKGQNIRQDMTEEGWVQLRSVIGTGKQYEEIANNSMKGLFDLTAEQMARLKEDAPVFWSQLDSEVQDYLDKIIDCNDAIEDNKDALKEALTGVTFDDFYDDFVSTLTDMDASAKDMSDNFEEYLRNAILQSLMANKYKSRIEALYNSWVEASDSNGDGELDLTAGEMMKLQESEKALAQEMIDERDAMADAFDWNTSASSAESGAFESMSEDTGEELNGRFAALQISGAAISQGVLEISSKIDALANRRDAYLNDILQAHALTNSWLESTYNMNKQIFAQWSEYFRSMDTNIKTL